MRWLFALVLPLVWAAPFVYPPYGDLVQRLQSLNASHPGYVNVWSAQDAYGIGSAGICHDSAQKPTPCKQWFIQITDEISLKDHPERPEVFFSGNLHGDEQVGPPTLLALAELLVANVVAFDSGSANANPWLARLVKTRVIVLLPVSNAIGYETINRLELGVDPNRDFPYSRAASQCMVTAVARSINEVWKEHLFQLSVTFHGGMQAIAYEWGAPNHLANDSESPDDTAQARICHSLSDYAGRFQGDTYPYGRLNKLVYWVDGGMEDWGYAAGWDLDAVTPCSPASSSLGPYPPSKTSYASSANLEAFRAFNILVETSDIKRPPANTLGSDQQLLVVEGAGDGHVPRNLRLALQLIDVVEPYLQTMSSTLRLQSSSGDASSVCSSLPPSRRRLRRQVQASVGPFADQYAQQVVAESCSVTTAVSVAWDVGGGYNVDSTQILVGQWPTALAPSEVFAPPSAEDAPVVAAWKLFLRQGAGNVSSLPLLATSKPQSGLTRWLDVPLPDLGASPYSSRFNDCVAVTNPDPTAPSFSLIVVPIGTLDQQWTVQPHPAPAVPPQSHVVNARTNPEWHKQNNGHVVNGRTVFVGKPNFLMVSCSSSSSLPSPSPMTSPTSPSADPSSVPSPSDTPSPTPLFIDSDAKDVAFSAPTVHRLVIYAVVVGLVLVGMVIVAVSVLLRSKRVPPVRVPIPSTTRRAGRSSRGYAKVTAAATDTIADHPEDDGKAVV